jgi:hypothetical protein
MTYEICYFEHVASGAFLGPYYDYIEAANAEQAEANWGSRHSTRDIEFVREVGEQ